MFAEQLRRAVEAAPRAELARVSGLLWRAYAAGQVTEAEASELSGLIEARKAVGAAKALSSGIVWAVLSDRGLRRLRASPGGGVGWRVGCCPRISQASSRPPRQPSWP